MGATPTGGARGTARWGGVGHEGARLVFFRTRRISPTPSDWFDPAAHLEDPNGVFRACGPLPYPATIRLVSLPRPSTSTVTSSPGFSQFFSGRPMMTPEGVPVTITSPGSSGKCLLM